MGPEQRARAACAVLGASLLAGCIVGDDRCSANQVKVYEKGAFDYCTCDATSVPDADGVGCVPCGAHASVEGAACVCDTGFARANAAAPCEEVPAGTVTLAQTCSDDSGCGDPYPYCAPSEADGYCTATGCSGHADCPTGFWCDASAATPFCHAPPTGLGMSCTTSADCTGFEAAYCEMFQAHVCLVADCASGRNVCRGASSCCDLSALVGSDLSLCVADDQLMNGSCPDGSAPVTP